MRVGCGLTQVRRVEHRTCDYDIQGCFLLRQGGGKDQCDGRVEDQRIQVEGEIKGSKEGEGEGLFWQRKGNPNGIVGRAKMIR